MIVRKTCCPPLLVASNRFSLIPLYSPLCIADDFQKLLSREWFGTSLGEHDVSCVTSFSSASACGLICKTEKDVDSSNKENESEVSAEIPLPPLPADWWGNKYGFVRAGHLGAQRDPPKVRTGDENATATSRDPSMRTAFREQDQEDLYNLVQVSPR